MPELWATLILKKPVVYDSAFANGSFVTGLTLHFIAGALGFVFGIIALCVKKGGPIHTTVGKGFAISMVFCSVSGIVLDIVRLMVNYLENHEQYKGFSPPSSLPARFSFMHMGLCVIAMVIEGIYGKSLRMLDTQRSLAQAISSLTFAIMNVLIGTWLFVAMFLW